MKKFLCYFLSIIILIGLLPVSYLHAEEDGIPEMVNGKILVYVDFFFE